MTNENVTYLFTTGEIAFMASSMGWQSIVGFPLGEPDFDAADAVNILNSLVMCGVYENTSEHFRLNEPFRTMIGMMCECQDILCIRFGDNRRDELCCYLSGRQILACSLFSEKVRMTLTDARGLWELISEDGLPQPKEELAGRLPAYTSSKLSELLSDGILGSNEITLWIERRNNRSGQSCDILLSERALGRLLLKRTGSCIEEYPYSPGQLKELLYTLLEMSL